MEENKEYSYANPPERSTETINADLTKSKKINLKIIIIISLTLLFAGTLAFFTHNSGNYLEKLCERGEYAKAYEKADNTEKEKIKAESIIAERFAEIVSEYDENGIFKLVDAYHSSVEFLTHSKLVCILYINNTESKANIYICYIRNNENEQWELQTALYEEDYQAVSGMIMREAIENTNNGLGTKLDENAINRINNMYKANMLDNIETIIDDTY